MKSTLLTTTALIAFAGAAAAEVTFSGSATLGYNDTTRTTATTTGATSGWGVTTVATGVAGTGVTALDDNQGFYWDANVAVTLSEELDNGLTASATFDFDVADLTLGDTLEAGSYVLSLTSDTAGLYFGDTAFAAETRWSGAGDMESDSFSEADGETVLRGDFEVAMVEASLSVVVADTNGTTAQSASGGSDSFDQMSFGAAADFGQFTVVAAYQEEGDLGNTANGDYNADEVFGLSVGATFSGADITVAYASDETAGTNSTGIEVSYPFSDAITATAYYVAEDDGTDEDNYGVNVAYASGAIAVAVDYDYDQGVDKWGVEGSYDLGNGITVLAGVLNENEGDDTDYYIAGTYDLGGGADLLVSYGVDDDFDQEDEIGANEYQEGATVEVNFTF
ncbi:porin [Yoonia sp. I 8.24]|uniref:porin n=1 Tax=Yoonia sp. I 8.24 TaxID=1537229 RepID=UPI001EDF89B4|nr:porin [Yoonia sp. I 8.24]MCG3268591.1 porin [Yoonia sp. I 8.24]